jgi:hypothetical protein
MLLALCWGSPCLVSGQSTWNLQWTKWHYHRLFSMYFCFPLSASFHQYSPWTYSPNTDDMQSGQLTSLSRIIISLTHSLTKLTRCTKTKKKITYTVTVTLTCLTNYQHKKTSHRGHPSTDDSYSNDQISDLIHCLTIFTEVSSVSWLIKKFCVITECERYVHGAPPPDHNTAWFRKTNFNIILSFMCKSPEPSHHLYHLNCNS